MRLSTVTYLSILVLLSFGLAPKAYAANISFTEDTELALTGLATTLYALSGSEADTLTVDGSTLTVDIPAGSICSINRGEARLCPRIPVQHHSPQQSLHRIYWGTIRSFLEPNKQ
jgi:hypothetical protein